MSGKTWHKLSPTAQGIWDQLDDESKALILGRPPPDSKRSGTFSRGKPGQKGPSRGTNKINLHDISAHDLLANYHQYQAHQTNISNDDAEVVLTDENVARTTDDSPSLLLAFLTSRGDNASPGNLRNVLSSTSSRAAKSKPTQQRQANFANLTYDVGKHRTTHRGALIDRGANGGIVGDDARIIAETSRVVNVQGIRDHQVTDLKIVSAGGVVDSQHGPVIAIFHQYAHMGSGKSIHSSIQLEAFGLEVNDKSCKVTGGRQRIVTPDGYVHPLQIKDGLAYLSMRPFTDKEWETLPHVHWTQDKDWDPSVLDHALGDHDEEWFDAVTDITELPNKHLFDEFGNYRRRTATVENHIIEPYSDLSIAINARNVQAQEMESFQEFGVFKDLGKGVKPPEGYKKVKLITVYDVKHDGRHKTRIVASGHLTDIPTESVYSGVVSLRGIRLLVFLAELNGLQAWATDISSAYLQAKTKEKLYLIAGAEFGDLEGHTLLVYKALYGLRTSGVRWHERLADCLRDMGFCPCRGEPDIWMRDRGCHWEYIGMYVDDLAIASEDPLALMSRLETKYGFSLKGTGPITYHLGCDFIRDKSGVLCIQPKKYIEKMAATYERLFGTKPKDVYTSPLEKGDHPEMDTSELLGSTGIQQYQSMVGAMQWAVSIGRLDNTTAVMTLSSFRVAPRMGHLEQCKRVYGYLWKMRHAMIRIRTEEPDYSAIPVVEYNWARFVYGTVVELQQEDWPTPRGKHVTLSHIVDANLYHDIVTGRSVMGILHLANKTPIDWYSKKQGTVETATFGSEFAAARTCTEQIIDLRDTLRYMGVPIWEESYMFGDNKTVVDSSNTPHGKLHKRHTMLAYHRVREAIASGIIHFVHIPGDINPADILSKHWGFQQIWKQLQPLLFWPGDTRELFDKEARAK